MQFKNIEQVLPEGEHLVKVFKSNEWVNGAFDKNSHKRTKPNKNGVCGYMYSTDVKYFDEEAQKERKCSLFAYDEKKKALLDSGSVKIRVLPKLNKQGKITFIENDNGAMVKEMTYFVNPVGTQNTDFSSPVTKDRDYSGLKEFDGDDIPIIEDGADSDEINVDDIPF